MGWTYEVTMWVKGEDGWGNEYVYQGESLIAAIFAMRRSRKLSGCVRFTWRG